MSHTAWRGRLQSLLTWHAAGVREFQQQHALHLSQTVTNSPVSMASLSIDLRLEGALECATLITWVHHQDAHKTK